MVNIPLFSIIIPIYNVEQYLNLCINSILNQKFNNFELILIDDGSTDNSGNICDEFAKVDKRIKVIHKENSGSSEARNAGIKKATGKYIIFLDSDDYWNKNDALNQLIEIINDNNPDIIFLKNSLYFEKLNKFLHPFTKFNRNKIKNQTKEQVLKYMIESQQLTVFAWDKVIKRDLILENNIQFEPGLYLDDIDWFPKIMLSAKTFDALNYCFYVYRKQRVNSITLTTDVKKLNQTFNTIKKWLVIIHKGNYGKEVKTYMFAFFALLYSVLMGLIHSVKKNTDSRNETKKLMNEVNKYSWILKYDTDLIVKVVKILYISFGINAVSFIMSKYSSYYYLNLYRFFTKLYLYYSSNFRKKNYT
jgi:glycosyltransferase involved in cell wall biosynthesis